MAGRLKPGTVCIWRASESAPSNVGPPAAHSDMPFDLTVTDCPLASEMVVLTIFSPDQLIGTPSASGAWGSRWTPPRGNGDGMATVLPLGSMRTGSDMEGLSGGTGTCRHHSQCARDGRPWR